MGSDDAASWQLTHIEDVLKRTVPTFRDERGAFSELWRASSTNGLGESFVQGNLSRSRRGVLRGMHFHLAQADLWIVLEGRVLAATTDLRPTIDDVARQVASQVIELLPGDELYIPRLVAHGFWALEETALMYLVSNEYDGTDERGFAWDDPLAEIDWPAGTPILSERDKANPPLAEVADVLRQQIAER